VDDVSGIWVTNSACLGFRFFASFGSRILRVHLGKRIVSTEMILLAQRAMWALMRASKSFQPVVLPVSDLSNGLRPRRRFRLIHKIRSQIKVEPPVG